MTCCGRPPQAYTPAPAPASVPAVGAQGLVLAQFVGAEPAAQFGAVTGAYYPFQAQRTLYVDARDLDRLREVQIV